MRLDRFLKVSRLVKRRTVASELCAAGRVRLNGRVAKAASQVRPGDVVEIGFGPRTQTIRVLEVREPVSAAEAPTLYEILDGTSG